MRTFALTIVAALAVGTITPALAAKSTSKQQQAYSQDQARDPEFAQRCADLARQRGYSPAQDRGTEHHGGSSAARRFIEGCMAGRFH